MAADAIGLIWYVKDHHPDPAVRAAVAASIREQVEQSGYAGQRPAISDALRAEQGTVLEPFELQETDIEDAADLACLAAGVGRELLVVSRDKLEPFGGVLLRTSADGLAARYVERFARATPTNLSTVWRFAPGLVPDVPTARKGVADLRAQVDADQHGHVIRCGPFDRVGDAGVVARSIQLVASKRHASTLRWRADVDRQPGSEQLLLRPGTPEDAIGLTALMIQGRWVILRAAADGSEVTHVAIRLALPEGSGPRELTVVPVRGDAAIGRISRWLLTDNVGDVVDRFGPLLIGETGRWVGLASGWESSEVLDSVS